MPARFNERRGDRHLALRQLRPHRTGHTMSERFESRADLASKIEWEGGILDAVDYGIRAEDMPEGDVEMAEAWHELEDAYAAADRCARRVEALLPELDSE